MKTRNAREKIEYEIQKKYIGICIGVCTIIVSLIIAYVGHNIQTAELPKPIDFSGVIKENQYAKIEIEMATKKFAEYEPNLTIYNRNPTMDNYYFIMNEDQIAVAILEEEKIPTLNKLIEYTYTDDEDVPAPEKLVVSGMSKLISEDVKKFIITSHNEVFQNNQLTYENFSEYIGTVYLDTKVTPRNVSESYYSVAIVAAIFGVMFILISIIQMIYSKKQIDKLTENFRMKNIYMEMNSPTAIEYKRQGVVLTDNYLIIFSPSVDVINYDEIKWIDIKTRKTIFINSTNYIVIVTIGGEEYYIAKTCYYGKENKETFNSCLEKLIENSPKASLGLTGENKEKIKSAKA